MAEGQTPFWNMLRFFFSFRLTEKKKNIFRKSKRDEKGSEIRGRVKLMLRRCFFFPPVLLLSLFSEKRKAKQLRGSFSYKAKEKTVAEQEKTHRHTQKTTTTKQP